MTVFPKLKLASARSPRGLSVLGLLLACHAATVSAAILGVPWLLLVAAAPGTFLDLLAARDTVLRSLLGRAQFGLINRTMLRELSVVILVLRVSGSRTAAAVAAMLLALSAVRLAVLALRAPLARRRLRPVEWRNLDVPVTLPWTPPAWARSGLQTPVLVCSVPLLLAVVGIPLGSWVLFFVASVGALAILGAMAVQVLRGLRSLRGATSDQDLLQLVGERVRALHPEVSLYFSGPASSMYQLNMWLPVLESMQRRVVIIVRERATLVRMDPTTIPVICLPRSTVLMDFRIPTVRIALYVVNVGKNLHYMREPRVKDVFIGHGESDKVASVNPFGKVYDEVWVAGRAARERWAAAKVGVRDEAIVEVGRPQLGGIDPVGALPAGRPLTVLYAPTWEGWTSDPFASSLLSMGPALVRWLLQRQSPTRVLYKPHPLTGTVSAQARAVHREIVAIMEHAGAVQQDSSVLGVDIRTALAEAPEGTETGQDPTAAGVPGTRVPDTSSLLDRPEHLVISGREPTLYECFNASDVMISDISSVVADFVASGKPFIITNPASMDHDLMRHRYSAARAAYLADPHPATWEPMMAQITSVDPLADARADLQVFLLGVHEEDPMTRWNAAIEDLLKRADEQWPDAELESALAEHE